MARLSFSAVLVAPATAEQASVTSRSDDAEAGSLPRPPCITVQPSYHCTPTPAKAAPLSTLAGALMALGGGLMVVWFKNQAGSRKVNIPRQSRGL